ncbi:MAG: hypothetical protein ACLUPV_06025 [Bilophila wadsworthia]
MEDASENLTVEVPVTETGRRLAATASPKRYAGELDTVEELGLGIRTSKQRLPPRLRGTAGRRRR